MRRRPKDRCFGLGRSLPSSSSGRSSWTQSGVRATGRRLSPSTVAARAGSRLSPVVLRTRSGACRSSTPMTSPGGIPFRMERVADPRHARAAASGSTGVIPSARLGRAGPRRSDRGAAERGRRDRRGRGRGPTRGGPARGRRGVDIGGQRRNRSPECPESGEGEASSSHAAEDRGVVDRARAKRSKSSSAPRRASEERTRSASARALLRSINYVTSNLVEWSAVDPPPTQMLNIDASITQSRAAAFQ